MILRIGVWFQENHTPYGGPGLVLAGTILGVFQYAEAAGHTIVVLLNEIGDINWSLGLTLNSQSDIYKIPNLWHGPACFNRSHAGADHITSDVWRSAHRALFPSAWFADFVSNGLPYKSGIDNHKCEIWPAGVDTDFFCPPTHIQKSQDYFIYFKSQNFCDLKTVQSYLFHNWFGITGTVICYYGYDAYMLRSAAQSSRFCIMLDDTETQGLAALEIMACGTPLFVLDTRICKCGDLTYNDATSVTNMDASCGLKSRIEDLDRDFPLFITNLNTYKPREFVCNDYSFSAAARRLITLISRERHKSQNDKEEKDCMDKKT